MVVCACGPIGATSVIGDAEIAVARAHTADGDRYAIYETTAADLYLQKAREEQGAAQYGAAMDLAHKAVALAEVAARKTAEAKRNPNASAPAAPLGQQRPAPPPAEIAPPPRVIVPGSEPPPRVIKPGDAAPAAPPHPKAEPVNPEQGRPDAGTPEGAPPAPSDEGSRRVIKPGEPVPAEHAPRKPKTPIEVDPGDKR